MARNRELSQLGSIINVKDSNQHVGIGTTNPGFKLDVVGDINSRTEVRVAGVGVATTSSYTGDSSTTSSTSTSSTSSSSSSSSSNGSSSGY